MPGGARAPGRRRARAPPTLASVNAQVSIMAGVSPIWPGDDHAAAHAKWVLWMRAAARYLRRPENRTTEHRKFIMQNFLKWTQEMAKIAVRDFMDSAELFANKFEQDHIQDIVNFLLHEVQIANEDFVTFLITLHLHCRNVYLDFYSEDDRQSRVSTPNPAAVQALLLC